MNKEQIIKFRCTSEEKKAIEKKAKESGRSISSFCRAAALRQKIDARMSEEEFSAYSNLAHFHTNFTRISNFIRNKDIRLYSTIYNTTKELEKHLKKFQ